MKITDTTYALLALGVVALASAGCTQEGTDPTVQSPGAGGDVEQPADEGLGADRGFGEPGAGDAGVGGQDAGQQGRAAGAGAQPGGQSGQYPPFEEVDADSDGQISRAELAIVEGVDFANVDTDQDGNVSRQEYMQAAEQQGDGAGGAGQDQGAQQGGLGQQESPPGEEQRDQGL